MDDAALVERAKAGSFEAFDELVRRHEERLYALLKTMLRSREDAEDAVQTAFVSALEHLKDFRGDASFATWITHVAVNAGLKLLRKRRGVSLDATDDEGELRRPDYIADWREPPERLLEREETKRALDEAIDALPEHHRVVFALRDVSGLSVEETAKAVGISEANVKVRLLRARLALRERLTRQFGDDSTRVRAIDHGGGA